MDPKRPTSIFVPPSSENIPSRDEVLKGKQPPASEAPPSQPPTSPEGDSNGASDFMDMVRRSRGAPDAGDKPRDSEESSKPDDEIPPVDVVDEDLGEEKDDKPDSEEEFQDPLKETEPAPKKKSKEENIKSMRTALQHERTERKKLETQLEEVNSRYEAVGDIDEVLEERDQLRQRVKELEPLQSLVDVYQNPEFQAKYVDGYEGQIAKARQVAQEYKVDPAVIDKALTIDNRKDLNTFLGKNFGDQYGVSEVREYILEAQKLLSERREIEKNPAQHKENLLQLARVTHQKRTEQALESTSAQANTAFSSILAHYTNGDSVVDLFKEKPADRQHNMVRQEILGRASELMGRTIGKLVNHGLTSLPTPVAQNLAAAFQLSQAAGHLLKKNRALATENKELKKTLREIRGVDRPGFNTSNGSTSHDDGPKNSKDIARHTFERAGQKLASSQTR